MQSSETWELGSGESMAEWEQQELSPEYHEYLDNLSGSGGVLQSIAVQARDVAGQNAGGINIGQAVGINTSLSNYYASNGNMTGVNSISQHSNGVYYAKIGYSYIDPNSYGGHGVGVEDIRFGDADQGGDDPRIRPSDSWFLHNGWDEAPWYGNFLGPGPSRDPYTLKGPNGKLLQPIDLLDAAAQRHDYWYNLAQTGGINGALFHDEVGAADRNLANAAFQVMTLYSAGQPDPITHQPISSQEEVWAQRVTILFGILGGLKGIGNALGH